ncbi:MAG: ImuA family protein [Sphingomonas sp.]
MTHAPASSLASLRRRIARLERQRPPAEQAHVTTGHAAIDAALGGGLALGRLHELFAAEPDDAGAAAGTAVMLACLAARDGPVVWLREADAERQARLHGPGLAELGLDPARLILGVPTAPLDLLRAAAEVVRCAPAAVAVIELWRQPRALDLTASRRLAVAAEGSGVTALLLRIAAEPTPSAAQTRWRVAAAPSAALAAEAPGRPAFDLELVRQRRGPEGQRWQVEWNRDARILIPATAPFSGAVVPLAEHRPAAAGG